MMRAYGDLEIGAMCVHALANGEDTDDADTGALMVAEFLTHAHNFFTRPR